MIRLAVQATVARVGGPGVATQLYLGFGLDRAKAGDFQHIHGVAGRQQAANALAGAGAAGGGQIGYALRARARNARHDKVAGLLRPAALRGSLCQQHGIQVAVADSHMRHRVGAAQPIDLAFVRRAENAEDGAVTVRRVAWQVRFFQIEAFGGATANNPGADGLGHAIEPSGTEIGPGSKRLGRPRHRGQEPYTVFGSNSFPVSSKRSRTSAAASPTGTLR